MHRKCVAPFTLTGRHECNFADVEDEDDQRPAKKMKSSNSQSLLVTGRRIEPVREKGDKSTEKKKRKESTGLPDSRGISLLI